MSSSAQRGSVLGSVVQASMPAPAISPDCTMSYRAFSSTQIAATGVDQEGGGLHQASFAASTIRSVSGRAGRCSVTKSLWVNTVQPHQLDTVFRHELHHGVRLLGDHSHVEVTARAAGVLCGRTGTSDVVDASVVLCAREREHYVVTSSPEDFVVLDAQLPVILV